MPKISDKRWEEIDKLQPVLDVLNGNYTSRRIIDNIGEVEGENSLENRPNLEDRSVRAEHVLRVHLKSWVEQWLKTKPPSPRADRDDYAAEYIGENAKVRAEFDRITEQFGISAPVFRALLAFQPPDKISGDAKFKRLVRIFRYFFEDVRAMLPFEGKHAEVQLGQGFLNSGDELLGAEGEAMRLFIALLRSDLSRNLRRCALPECGLYFLNLGGRREFCSRKHAQARVNSHVLPRLKKERQAKKKRELARARKAMKQCTAKDWKRWVAKRTGLSMTFLTRNINTTNLTVPKRLRGRNDDL